MMMTADTRSGSFTPTTGTAASSVNDHSSSSNQEQHDYDNGQQRQEQAPTQQVADQKHHPQHHVFFKQQQHHQQQHRCNQKQQRQEDTHRKPAQETATTTTRQTHSVKGCCSAISTKWVHYMDMARNGVSRGILLLSGHAAMNPRAYVLGITLLSLGLVGIGLSANFEMNVDTRADITAFNSVIREQWDWIENESGFPSWPRSLRVLIHANGNNVLTTDGMERVFDVINTVQSTDSYLPYCERSKENNQFGVQGECHIRSISLFWNHSHAVYDELVHSNVDIALAASSNEKYPDGSSVEINEIIGKVEFHFDTIISAESLLMEVLIPSEEEDGKSVAGDVLNNLLALRRRTNARGNGLQIEVFLTGFSLEAESYEAAFRDVPLVPFVFVIMTIFTCIVFSSSPRATAEGRSCLKEQRIFLGFSAVLTIAMSLCSSYGLMWIIGVPFSSATQVLPFVMFGIGLDDAFIIFGEYIRQDPSRSVTDRIHSTFEEVGLSVFMTTLTTTLAFGLNIGSQIPILFNLSLYAFSTVLIDGLYQVTYFVALIAIDEQRIERKRLLRSQGETGWCLGCKPAPSTDSDSDLSLDDQSDDFKSKKRATRVERAPSVSILTVTTEDNRALSEENLHMTDRSTGRGIDKTSKTSDCDLESYEDGYANSDEATRYRNNLSMIPEGSTHSYHFHVPGPPTSPMDRFMSFYAGILLKKPVRYCVIICFLAVSALLAYSASQFRQEFNIFDVLSKDSYVLSYFGSVEKYDDRGFIVPQAYFRGVDQSDPDVQAAMVEYVDELVQMKSITNEPPFFWVKHFELFLAYDRSNDQYLVDLTFNEQMDIFLSLDIFKTLYGDHIIRDPESGDIVASRCVMYVDNLDMGDVHDQIAFWREQLDITEAQPFNSDEYIDEGEGFNFFFHEDNTLFGYEFYAVMVNEVVLTAILGIVVVAAVTFMIIPHWSAALFLGPMMAVSFIDLIGFIQMWGVRLNIMSAFGLIMSIGLLVDFQMHILLRYYESPCRKRELKVKDALQTMGSSVVIGGLSTFLGVVPLLLSTSSIFQSLLKAFWGMVIIGLSHGVIVLPVILSFCGPVATVSLTKKNQSDTDAADCDESFALEHSRRQHKDTDPMNSSFGSLCHAELKTYGEITPDSTHSESRNENKDMQQPIVPSVRSRSFDDAHAVSETEVNDDEKNQDDPAVKDNDDADNKHDEEMHSSLTQPDASDNPKEIRAMESLDKSSASDGESDDENESLAQESANME